MATSRRLIHQTLFLLLPFLLAGCVSIIEFEGSDKNRELVIYGKLTNSQAYDQGITVKWSDLNTSADLAIEDASVVVLDENDQQYPYAFSAESGKYLPVNSFIGVPGTTYRARITVNDQIYQSSPQRMPTVGTQDTAYYRVEKELLITDTGAELDQYRVKILTDSRLDASDEDIFMRWDVEQVFILAEVTLPVSKFPFFSPSVCYIHEGYANEDMNLFNGERINKTFLQEQELANVLMDNNFINIRGYGIIQSSITREAMIYWEKVNQVAIRDGSIFEVPPAPVPGNFSNLSDPDQVPLGFFEVTKVDTTGTYVLQGDLPIRFGRSREVPNCSFPIGLLLTVPYGCFSCLADLGVPDYCLNCSLVPNSTRIRPSYLF
ncbi:MAG: DUF4249 family protein [Cytophagales bacterium]|nr:DUF4249 family protein [Cytophagales bacterium]